MTEELSTNLATEIRDWHGAAETNALQAKHHAQDAMHAAIQCGDYLAQADKTTKGHLLAWLRDNVPDLTHERAKAYLSLFHTHAKREAHKLDHRTMIQLEIIDVAPGVAKPSTGFAQPKWVGWVGSTRAYFDEITRDRPLDQWDREEREAVADQLAPIVALWKRLTGEGA